MQHIANQALTLDIKKPVRLDATQVF